MISIDTHYQRRVKYVIFLLYYCINFVTQTDKNLERYYSYLQYPEVYRAVGKKVGLPQTHIWADPSLHLPRSSLELMKRRK